jgi:pyruvate dehydrogenase E2 component (dihydrolipoamide acetyltransferase)
VNDIVVKAVAVALRAHPEVNVSFGGDKLIRHRRIHVGIAVALPDGLIVPVIRDADTKTVTQISAETRDLAARARSGKLKVDEFTGSTFSVSNLGMFGVDQFTAVINPPEAAILAVGATKQEAVVRDGQVVVGYTMAITLSVDHRALDGATGAKFLADLTALLENPLATLA